MTKSDRPSVRRLDLPPLGAAASDAPQRAGSSFPPPPAGALPSPAGALPSPAGAPAASPAVGFDRRRLLQTALAAPVIGAPLLAGLGVRAQERGPLEVTIAGGDFEPIVIATPVFVVAEASLEDPTVVEIAREISDVVRTDLERSGLFQPVTGDAVIGIHVAPNFGYWRNTGAEALLVGEVGIEPDGRLGVSVRLWNVARSQQTKQVKFLADPSGRRRVGHKVADEVYTALTGERGYFDSRVVFVSESGPKAQRRKRLAIMDWDGANFSYLTHGNDTVITPRFSPDDQAITYISFETGSPQVYLLNLRTERQEVLGQFPPGMMTFAPRFAPDGDRLVLSLARSGATDIYLMELATRRVQRLTESPGIDTAPSFEPEGRAIVFESDRSGSQQLYVMGPQGQEPRRLTFSDGRYANPVWSPVGDWIAFTKVANGRFHIGIIRPDGTDERLLASSFHNEGPTWSPNGRVIMFFREPEGETGLPQLFTVNIDGRNLRPVPTPRGGGSDPAWSPLLRP